jgi:DNA-binding MarR family transcriptional regulator
MKTKAKVVPMSQPLPHAFASLADSVALLRTNGFETITEAAIFCAALGEPTTLAQITKSLKLPFSSASRIAWALEQRGLLSYHAHPTDRRMKLIRANVERLESPR